MSLPDGKSGIQSVPRAARERRTCAAQVGDSTTGNRREPQRRNLDGVVLGGASCLDRRIAQACNGVQ